MARLDLTPLHPWAEAALGARLIAVEDASWPHAASAVARVTADDGRVAYLKRHRQPRKHRQERAALRAWAPAVAGTPRLLAATTTPAPALLLSPVPGVLVPEAPTIDGAAVHAAAGSWLRAWHDQPFRDDDPMPPHEALLARLDGWAERAGAALTGGAVAAVRAQLAALAAADLRRIPCHRDFGPRNWLWEARATGDAGFGVIDFEHARPDVAWVDVLKLVDGAWLARPDLAEAFWRGYGRRPTPSDEAVIDALRALHAVGTIAWARAHDDPAFEGAGRATLARLGIDAS
ncbi:MAG: phosphotransferase [Trueperaceae bacterium]|nr:phosphotransferase [Trueperaceae bacterium]